MPCRHRAYFLLIFITIQSNCANGQGIFNTLKLHTDYPSIEKGKKLTLLVYYTTDISFKANFQIQSFLYQSEKDSLLVFNKRNLRKAFKKGTNKLKIDLSKDDTNTQYCTPYYEILKRTGNIAPGTYKTIITLTDPVSKKQFRQVLLQSVDSSLTAGSPVRTDVNNSFIHKRLKSVQFATIGNALATATKKIDKKAKQRGLSQLQYQKNGKSYIDYYFQDWFAGRYEVNNNQQLGAHLQSEQSKADAETPDKLATNDLDAHPSLCSQFKTFKQQQDDNQQIKGEISFANNASNGQEPYSSLRCVIQKIIGMALMGK